MTEVASTGNFIMKESIKELNDLKESWKSSKLAVFNKMAGIFNQKRTICKKRDALLDLVLFVQFTKPETLLKVTLLHGCFQRFLNSTNGTKSHNASHSNSNTF